MKLFLDTAFVQALLNKNDKFHEIAKTLLPQFKNATEVMKEQNITDAMTTDIHFIQAGFNALMRS